MAFQLNQTKITVEGNTEKNGVHFTNLVINQYLSDVNSFSFTWRQPEGKSSLSAHVAFYKKNLSKKVTITINEKQLKFEGVIYSINCHNQDTLGVSYEVMGKGMFMKLDEVPECNSFFKQTLDKIFGEVTKSANMKVDMNAQDNSELFYTVQYNQTGFEFMRMMASRYGQWFYYDGQKMILGKPSSASVSLKRGDYHSLDINARTTRAPHNIIGFDNYKGEQIDDQKKENVNGSGLLEASAKAADNAYGAAQAVLHLAVAATKEVMKAVSTLKQKAAASTSVFISARSYNCNIKLAGKVKLFDEKDKEDGDYIVTEIHHSCIKPDNYQNHFVAIPADVEVPPNTDPLLHAVCKPQLAIVVENEDDKKLDRIKVRFPWMKAPATTPWIQVLTPHAGKDKGIRFLPEKEEEVIIGFQDNNAERPFMMGAIHTEKNQSGNEYASNFKKTIGTKTGRRVEIDDDLGFIKFVDNYVDKKPINIIQHNRKDDKIFLSMQSIKDDNTYSILQLNHGEKLGLLIHAGGQDVAKIYMDGNSKKIVIESKGEINVTADQKMNFKSPTINITADNDVNIEGKGKGVNIKGMEVKVEANTNMTVKGMNTKVEGSMNAEFKGGMLASLTAAIVKIN
jgi:phage baseplate assembly protein gpV